MKHRNLTVGLFATVSNRRVSIAFAGFLVSVHGALPVWGVEAPPTAKAMSAGDGEAPVVSAAGGGCVTDDDCQDAPECSIAPGFCDGGMCDYEPEPPWMGCDCVFGVCNGSGRCVWSGPGLKDGIWATIVEIKGDANDVIVTLPNGTEPVPTVGVCLREGTTITTGPDAYVVIKVHGYTEGTPVTDSALSVRPITTMTIDRAEIKGQSIVTRLAVKTGDIRVKVVQDRVDLSTDLKVATPNATASIRGTDFLMSSPCRLLEGVGVGVIEGTVSLKTRADGLCVEVNAQQRALSMPDGTIEVFDTGVLVSAVGELGFGDVLVGNTRVMRLFLANSGPTPLTVSSLSVVGDGFAVESAVPIDPLNAFVELSNDPDIPAALGNEFEVAVSLTPTIAGTDVNGVLTISGDFPDVEIALAGAGISSIFDCNGNSTSDEWDVCKNTSRDCNVNGIPDECELDANGNGVPDECEIVPPLPVFAERVISTNGDQSLSVFATDLDGDGDIDVVSASFNDDTIVWYESDGGSPPNLTEHVISTIADGARSVFAKDVDGDGNIDVLSASQNDDKIAWYQSDGGSPPSFTERVISTAADGAFSVFAIDVDGDGNIDVLSASRNDNKVAWYESDGGSPPSFTERVISTNALVAQSVFATDLDCDGDTDVLSASAGDDKIAWYENDGGLPPSFAERAISTNADNARSVSATDIDGSLPPSFTEQAISTTADNARSVFATDIDGDLDIDVLSASLSDDKIAWYESDGLSPPTFTERVISTAADGAVSVFATDLDGDGDTDVLSASRNDNKIAWYESDGGSPPSFTERVISTGAGQAFSVIATDFDGDGDIDVLSASQSDDKVAWYENTTCGDGLVEGTEVCDDGGESVTCDTDCTPAECGDGTVNQTAGEQCDDGNTQDNDFCLSTCDFNTAIPAVSEWGLVAMSLLVLTAGTLVCSRRRVRSA